MLIEGANKYSLVGEEVPKDLNELAYGQKKILLLVKEGSEQPQKVIFTFGWKETSNISGTVIIHGLIEDDGNRYDTDIRLHFKNAKYDSVTVLKSLLPIF